MNLKQLKWILVLSAFLATSLSFGASKTQKDWTMLVFLNGHNSLDSFGQINVDQMKTVGSTKNVNVVVQWASTSYGKTRRVFVQKNNPQVIEELDPVDMGDYNSLIAFIKWGIEKYPAKHYLIDVWNHGNGWKLKSILSQKSTMHADNISYDDISGHSISIPELGKAMKEASVMMGHKVDIYGSDACLMAMVEVDYELSDSVAYVVGSEETEPGAGWVYDKLLTQWGKDAPTVAKTIVSTYVGAYTDVTMAAVDESQISGLATSLSDLKAAISPTFMKDAASKALSFTYPDYIDIGDFLTQLVISDPTMTKYADEVTQAMDKFVILSQANGVKSLAHGVSIWIPLTQTSDMDRYTDMQFPVVTGWADLIKSLWK